MLSSYGLICNLLLQNFTSVGTVMADRRWKVLKHCMTIWSKFCSFHTYQNETGRMFSWCLFYLIPFQSLTVTWKLSYHGFNKHIGGVDTLDKNCEKFNCLSKTNLWPMVIIYNLINVASNNAYIIMRDTKKTRNKTNFLKQLTFQLAQPYVKNMKLTKKTKLLAEKVRFIDATSNSELHN